MPMQIQEKNSLSDKEEIHDRIKISSIIHPRACDSIIMAFPIKNEQNRDSISRIAQTELPLQ